ncbi:MAG: hypothetical protein ACRDEA_22825, partial [Microcystaceae cyanobacterium]
PTTGGKQPVYSGTITYESDTGTTVTTPVKVLSDTEGSPPSNVGTVWTGCVGPFLSQGFSCGASTKREHRRYLLSLRVGSAADPGPPAVAEVAIAEQKEVPVKDQEANLILTCGQNIAALTGLFCLGYKGESYNRFHRVLTLP